MPQPNGVRTARFQANQRYLPVDELLELPRVRVLRVLKHFDWADMRQICDSLNESSKAAWMALNSALIRHVRSGSVERCADRVPHQYRITAAGRDELASILARGEVNERKR